MYFLFRLLTENRIESIVEFGSGQSTILIDRLRADSSSHVCYEEDAAWHASVSAKIPRCDYRLSPLEQTEVDGVICMAYSGMTPVAFDFMLVDGPRGVDEYSRFGCVETIRANTTKDFVIVFDDCDRPGERQTIQFVEQMLSSKGVVFRKRELHGRTSQAILATAGFTPVLYYW